MPKRNFRIPEVHDESTLTREIAATRRRLHFHHRAALTIVILGAVLISLFNVMALATSIGQNPPDEEDTPCALTSCDTDQLFDIDDAISGDHTVPETPPTPILDGTEKLIALTFDDGPHGILTPRLLDHLAEANVPATFFVLGTNAAARPDIVTRAHAEGHEIGSHSFRHSQLPRLSLAALRADFAATDAAIVAATTVAPAVFRPPYGLHNATVRNNSPQALILWSIDPRDWADRDAHIVYNRVVDQARDGAIILLHDIHASTVEAVPWIITSLKTRGFTFVTVSQLFELRGITLEPGRAYLHAPPAPAPDPEIETLPTDPGLLDGDPLH